MKTLLPVLLILISVGLFFFKVHPLYSEVQGLRADSSEYDRALKMADELSKIRVDLAHTLDSFSQTDLDRLDHFLPRNLDTVRIIMDLDAVAARDGIRLTDIRISDAAASSAKVSPTASAKGYSPVDISFSFSGTYDQGKLFVGDLQRSLRLFDVTSMTVAPSTVVGINDFKMIMQTYWINR